MKGRRRKIAREGEVILTTGISRRRLILLFLGTLTMKMAYRRIFIKIAKTKLDCRRSK